MSSQSETSLLKKVAGKITDEVSQATSKIQNMQIIDHLSSTISQPSIITSLQPNQLLPEPKESFDDCSVDGQHSLSDINHFSLIDGSQIIDYSNNHNSEELAADSDISPQHQLFNNQAIIPLTLDKPSNSSNHVSQPKRLDDSNNLNSGNNKNKDEHASSDSHHGQSSKANLLAKFKESLRLKNSQIKKLKDALCQVEQFEMYADDLKKELDELRASHETWTISIAENKRTMHEEMEAKNGDIKRLKTEADCLQIRLKDSQTNIKQLKSRIQELESRLVSMSVAHQKERESLTKELTTAKNNAIKQLHKEHELNIERVKLEFEKTIETLKSDVLSRDHQIIENAKQSQQLLQINSDLNEKVVDINRLLNDKQAEIDSLKNRHDAELEQLKSQSTIGDANCEELERLKVEYDKLKDSNKIASVQADRKLELATGAIKQQENEIEKLKLEASQRDTQHNEYTKQVQRSLDSIVGLEKLVADLSKQLVDKQAEVDTLRQQHDEKLKELEAFKLKATLCDANYNQLAQLKSELNGIKANLEETNCKLESATSGNEEFEKEIDLLRSERKKLTDQCRDLQLELAESKASNDQQTTPSQDSYSNSTEFEYLRNIGKLARYSLLATALSFVAQF